MIQKINSIEEYHTEYQKSVKNPEQFWAEKADTFTWKKKWDKVLDFDLSKPEMKWFEGAELNITENCLDRHLATRGNQTAIIWEPNDPNEANKELTYKELHEAVCKYANVLKKHGAKKGDRICIYMPMVPEAAIAILACARIGAIHSVVFAGFSAQSLSDRINDATCSMVLTSDGAYRGNKTIPLKNIVDEALASTSSVEKVVVLQRTNEPINMQEGRDIWLHEELETVDSNCPAEVMSAEDMLFILYTSGSTGKPKGIVHTCAGYMVYAEYSFRNVFQYEDGDIYWCTADVGWITGHTYIVYGPLLAGAVTVMSEGVPTYPDAGRFWDIVEKYKVNQFYTAPTAIRALEACGLEWLEGKDLSSIKTLGTVGEPINEDAWHWYDKNVGKGNAPIVDTWWQTETGGIMISPLSGHTKTKPTFATLPLPGIQPVLMNENGKVIEENGVEGRLCMKYPWPSMARTIYGNHQRFKETYYTAFPNHYFTGDGCKRDEDGYYRITGRVDDVLIVSGHNLGTAEIENAINEHDSVVESAVVGYPHHIKGNAVYAYVTLAGDMVGDDALRAEITKLVSDVIGPIAKPDKIQFTTGLPKTRSGKIMRRILRKVAEGDTSNLGDISTLLNPGVVEDVKKGALV